MIEYTFEEIEHLKKCLAPDYFAKQIGLKPFAMQINQREIGMTREDALTFVLWKSQFHQHNTLVIIENTQDQAMQDIAWILEYYNKLPLILQSELVRKNKSMLEFENGTRIIAGNNIMTLLKGRSVNHILISFHLDADKVKERDLMCNVSTSHDDKINGAIINIP